MQAVFEPSPRLIGVTPFSPESPRGLKATLKVWYPQLVTENTRHRVIFTGHSHSL